MTDPIKRLRELLATGTPGKWWWHLNVKSNNCTLYSSGAGGGWRIVMDFVRYGMRRACPRFQVKGLMFRANELPDGHEPDHNGDAKITHPDAELIVAAVNALPALLNALELYQHVAESARSQWGDDFLWEKWGHDEDMKKADAAMAALEKLEEAK